MFTIMNFTISDKKKKEVFVSIFSLLKNTSSQINATFYADKLHIQGMDKSHVCLFDLIINQEWFNSYLVDKMTKCCFDTNTFYSMINIKNEEQILNIKLLSNDELTIELVNNDGEKKDYNKYFTLPLLETEYDELSIPSPDYDAEFSLTSKKTSEIFSQLKNFGDDINIICSDDFIDLKTKSNSGEMRVNIPVDDMSSYSVIEGEQVSLTYSLIYINTMCITNKLTNEIDFSLSNEFPMKIYYNLGEKSSLVFYIAPKLED